MTGWASKSWANAAGAAALGVCILLSPRATAQGPNTGFTYQGQLKDASGLASGPHDMRFRLFADPSDPNSALGLPICKDGVNIQQGLFSVTLDFGAAPFQGNPLWMEIAVRSDAAPGNCSSGAYTTLTPRQPLAPAPLAIRALSAPLLLPVNGDSPLSPVFDIENTTSGGATTFAGIFRVRSTGNNSRAVTGIASGGSGLTYGVYGDCTSDAGVGVQGDSFGLAGVRGIASHTTNPNCGVYGESNSSNGRGVAGIATATSGATYGGRFENNSSNGIAVYGQANSPGGWAGYFVGLRSYFAGSVGIGTSNPSYRLHVLGGSTGELAHVQNNEGGRAAGFESRSPSSTSAVLCYKEGGPALHVLGTFSQAGTVATDAPLAVAGGSDSAQSGGGYMVLGPTNGANISIDNNEIMARSDGGPATLFLNNDGGNVHLIPNGTGSVGIGTNAPQQKLDVDGNVRISAGLYFSNSVVNPDGWVDNVLSFGDPGVGEDYMTYAEGEFWFQDSPGGGDTTGPALYAHDFVSASDIRLKKEIEPLRDALDKVRRLQGIRYRFDGTKVDPAGEQITEDRLHLGFSAQAVAEVVPEVVHYSEKFDRYGVSYGSLVPLLVEALKEQQAQIDSLRAELAELKAGR